MVKVGALPGVEVTVYSSGLPLREYEDSALDDGELITSRYIECCANTTFEVRTECFDKISLKGQALQCDIYVDGRYVDNAVKDPDTMSGTLFYVSRGVRVAEQQVQEYQFSSMQRQEAAATVDPATVKQLGCITIVFSHVNVGQKTVPRYQNAQELGMPAPISEKSLKGKAVSNVVSFGQQFHQVRRNTWTTNKVADAAFVNLYYRTEEDLKAMCIIPRSPSPAPIEEQDAEALSIDDVRKLQERLRRFEASQTASQSSIKREREAETSQTDNPARKQQKRVMLVLDDDDDTTFREVPMSPKQAPGGRAGPTSKTPVVESVDLS